MVDQNHRESFLTSILDMEFIFEKSRSSPPPRPLNSLTQKLERQQQRCESLFYEYQSYSDREMNKILFILTIVTAFATPLQCLSGYYGMNFVDDNGVPTDWQLTWGFGMWYFWILTSVLTGLMVFWVGLQRGWWKCKRLF